MPPKKRQRTPTEEAEAKRARREKKTASERIRVNHKKLLNSKNKVIHIFSEEQKIECERDRSINVPSCSFVNLVDDTVHNRSLVNSYSRQQDSVPVIKNNISPIIEEHYIGRMNVLCTHCNAKHFDAERVSNKLNSFNDCCSHGEVSLERLPDPPSILKSLYDGSHKKSNHFF